MGHSFPCIAGASAQVHRPPGRALLPTIGKSLLKSKYADSVVEADTRIGHVMDKLRALGLDKGNTLVFWTTAISGWIRRNVTTSS
jgi:membrane-anchored protein YejM (alkaline phosphatase superfamily)